MQKNRAQLLLDKINDEFSLTSLKQDSTKLMEKAPLCDIILELSKLSNCIESKVLKDTVIKLRSLGVNNERK